MDVPVKQSNSNEIHTNGLAINEKNLSKEDSISKRRLTETENQVVERPSKVLKELNSLIQTKDNRDLAKNYPFELDQFQKDSVEFIEKNESVLVAAHTSAGKTAIAEYAIALALKNNQRVIYTSPIKALSNQKFRDLSAEFSDVGLLTGDVTINPNASCLVMTTEILRSMLYRGSEVIREVAWAIFDEVHYMKDTTRGVVWEESIILLPHNVRYVFLSATIPNAQQFADWIKKIHHQECRVVYTEYRPTPLQHYMYPSNGDGIHLIVNEAGKFSDDNFHEVMKTLGTSNLEEEVLTTKKKRKRSNKEQDLTNLVNMIMNQGFGPCIVFSFSKKDCEKFAKRLSKLELASPEESTLIEEVFVNAIDALKKEDKELPQIQSLLPLLKRGVGIHHGGLLPLLKEIVEILFGEGLIKVLFATETFAMGINMPAKTVIFTSMRKFDGKELRWVKSGEYIQMSGRAGRRGLDDRGIVIQMVDELLQPDLAKQIMCGQAAPLTSTFYLNYNMLLNLYRIEDSDPEYIIRNSLLAFQQEQEAPALKLQIQEIETQVEDIVLDKELERKYLEYHLKIERIEELRAEMRTITMIPRYVTPFIKEGRCLKLLTNDNYSNFGIVVKTNTEASNPHDHVIVVLTLCEDLKKQEKIGNKARLPLRFSQVIFQEDIVNSVPKFVSISYTNIAALSVMKLKSVHGLMNLENARSALVRLNKELSKGMKAMDPIEDQGITNPRIGQILEEAGRLTTEAEQNEVHQLPKESKHSVYKNYIKKYDLKKEQQILQQKLAEVNDVPMKDKLGKMKVVLKQLQHLSPENVINIKGRVACEISTAHELVVAELLLSGEMNNWSPAVTASVLSCVIYTERGEDGVPLPHDLRDPYKKLLEVAKNVAEVEKDANMEMVVDEFVEQFKPDIMEAVFAWCSGKRFSEVMQLTGVFEGSLIRCIRRLVELLRQLCVASKIIGDVILEALFKGVIQKMKRDIIFAGSLYLQE